MKNRFVLFLVCLLLLVNVAWYSVFFGIMAFYGLPVVLSESNRLLAFFEFLLTVATMALAIYGGYCLTKIREED